MQKARLVKAGEVGQKQAESPQPRTSHTGQLRRAVAEWVSERRSERQNAKRAFDALFALDGIMK